MNEEFENSVVQNGMQQNQPVMQNGSAAISADQGIGVVPPYAMDMKKPETEHSKKLRESFGFFAPVTLLYAAFYAFCMYKNESGITYPFFMAGSLIYMCVCFGKLTITLKKGSIFYMVGIMLLAISTFCTDSLVLIDLNKTGIFLGFPGRASDTICPCHKVLQGKEKPEYGENGIGDRGCVDRIAIGGHCLATSR